MKNLILIAILILTFYVTSNFAEAITINVQPNHMVTINNVSINANDVTQISYSSSYQTTSIYMKNGDIKTFRTSYDEYVLIQQALSVHNPPVQTSNPVISPVSTYVSAPNYEYYGNNYGYNNRVSIVRTTTNSPYNNYNNGCNTYNSPHDYPHNNNTMDTRVNMTNLPVSQPALTTAQYSPQYIPRQPVPTYYSSPHIVPSYY